MDVNLGFAIDAVLPVRTRQECVGFVVWLVLVAKLQHAINTTNATNVT